MTDITTECVRKNQCREVIISAQVPIEWALPLYGYVMPIIVAITIATNSFIVAVLSRTHLRTPTNIVLLAMAVTELLTGLSSVPWLLYYYTFKGYKNEETLGLPAFWCGMFPYMASILPSIFHTAAIWLTVYLAVQRNIYICKPKMVQKHCTMRRSKQAIVMICLVSISIYAPEFFASYNKSHKVQSTISNQSRLACFRYRTTIIDFVGSNIYYYATYGTHTLLSHTLPCILLVWLSWKLIATIRLADQRYAHLVANRINANIIDNKIFIDSNTDTNQYDGFRSDSITGASLKSNITIGRRRPSTFESKRVQSLKQNTRMLIAVILLFLVTEIPAAIIFSLHVVAIALRIMYMQKHYIVLNKLLIVRNVLIIITYPMRFAIYCGMSQQFRDCVSKMLMSSKQVTVGKDDIKYEHITATRNSHVKNNCVNLTKSKKEINVKGGILGVCCNFSLSSTDTKVSVKQENFTSPPLIGSLSKISENGCAHFVTRTINNAPIDALSSKKQNPQGVIMQIDDSGCAIDSDELSNDSRNDETI